MHVWTVAPFCFFCRQRSTAPHSDAKLVLVVSVSQSGARKLCRKGPSVEKILLFYLFYAVLLHVSSFLSKHFLLPHWSKNMTTKNTFIYIFVIYILCNQNV
jgi:hypothetical protein